MTPRIMHRKHTDVRASRRWELEPEVRLMLRVKGGQPGAFEELVERYWPRIFGRFYKQLGDRQEAEDLAQDVFLRLYRNRRHYQPRASFATWIYHIARNVARNAVRSRLRRPCLSLGQVMRPEHEDTCAQWLRARRQESPMRPLERQEAALVVRGAVAALARRQRTALELQFLDCTYSEIAAELNMTPKAAKSLLYRARLQLRASLNTYATV